MTIILPEDANDQPNKPVLRKRKYLRRRLQTDTVGLRWHGGFVIGKHREAGWGMDDMIHQVTHGGGPEPLLYKQAVPTVDRANVVDVVIMFYI